MAHSSLIEFLSDPASYPERPGAVSLVQTHISWVFIGDGYVYKVKKPVDFGFLNFTTLEKRRFYTAEELRLNKRFSPEVYLSVVPISKRSGAFLLGDQGNVVEYALKMRRISEDHMLYRLLEKGRAGADELRRVGSHLARVYGAIASDDKARAFGGMDVISHNIVENFEQTAKYIGGPLSQDTYNTIRNWSITSSRQGRTPSAPGSGRDRSRSATATSTSSTSAWTDRTYRSLTASSSTSGSGTAMWPPTWPSSPWTLTTTGMPPWPGHSSMPM